LDHFEEESDENEKDEQKTILAPHIMVLIVFLSLCIFLYLI